MGEILGQTPREVDQHLFEGRGDDGGLRVVGEFLIDACGEVEDGVPERPAGGEGGHGIRGQFGRGVHEGRVEDELECVEPGGQDLRLQGVANRLPRGRGGLGRRGRERADLDLGDGGDFHRIVGGAWSVKNATGFPK